MDIPFTKMSGAGNDFIIIDNRQGGVTDKASDTFIRNLCRRKMAVGADGLILIESSEEHDFKWRFFNSDGFPAEMCGNGARCAARYAFLNKIAGAIMVFKTDAGLVEARVDGAQVKINMPAPTGFSDARDLDLDNQTLRFESINTGVPHVVITVDDLENTNVVALGRRIRHHAQFLPAGTNVNFIAATMKGELAVRTYERGVEDETLACGTGAVAAALVYARQHAAASPVRVCTRSGAQLNVFFVHRGNDFTDIRLEGDARVIYHGRLCEDAWEY